MCYYYLLLFLLLVVTTLIYYYYSLLLLQLNYYDFRIPLLISNERIVNKQLTSLYVHVVIFIRYVFMYYSITIYDLFDVYAI